MCKEPQATHSPTEKGLDMRGRLNKTIGWLWIAMAGPSPAFAQGAAPTPVTTPAMTSTPGMELVRFRVMQVYEELLEKRSREILARYLPVDQFSLSVEVEVKSQVSMDLPYMPGGGSIFPENINSPIYRDLIQKVSLEVLFVKSVDDNSRKQLVEVLKRGLKLDGGRGDMVKAGDFVLNFAKPSDEFSRRLEDIERKLRLTEEDLRRSQRDSDILAREKAELNNKLELAQKQQQEQKSEEKPAETKKEAEKPEGKPAEVGTTREPDLQFWVSKGLIAGLGLFTLVILLLVSRTLAAAIDAIGKGIGSLGASLQGIGGGGASKGSETKVEINQTGSGPQGAVSGAAPAMDIEAARRRLAELQHELLEKVSDDTQPIILQFLTRTLRQETSVARGVAAMELLGAEMANTLYKKLGDEARAAVQKFLNGPGYGNNKYDIMLEAGENLKTNLLSEGLASGRFVRNVRVIEYLTRMDDRDIEELATMMDVECLARFLLYFESGRMALLLGAICQRNPALGQVLADIMLILPEAESQSDWDQKILEHFAAWEGKQKANTYGPYLKLYTDIVANLGEELTEGVLSKIDQANQMVSSYLRSQIVTYNLLYTLGKSIFEEIVNGQGNKDIAALILGAQGDEKKRLIDAVSERRREMVTEEVETLQNLDGKRLKPRVKEARAKVVQIMEQMKKEGKLAVEAEENPGVNSTGMVAA